MGPLSGNMMFRDKQSTIGQVAYSIRMSEKTGKFLQRKLKHPDYTTSLPGVSLIVPVKKLQVSVGMESFFIFLPCIFFIKIWSWYRNKQ